MEGTCNEFFARTGLACYQNSNVTRTNLVNLFYHPEHRGTSDNEAGHHHPHGLFDSNWRRGSRRGSQSASLESQLNLTDQCPEPYILGESVRRIAKLDVKPGRGRLAVPAAVVFSGRRQVYNVCPVRADAGFLNREIDVLAVSRRILQSQTSADQRLRPAVVFHAKNSDELHREVFMNDRHQLLEQQIPRGGGLDEPLHEQ